MDLLGLAQPKAAKTMRYRYFLARSQTLTGQPLVRRSMSEFIEDFGFKSLELARLGEIAGCPLQFSPQKIWIILG